ncbi:phospholipase D-like domain-containing protein [Fodinibius salsisoli]|uniref:Cardiolipin synthase B n=1 Tax=Fodinibius salsisoli TaxID=2820877 RepID=A0ABT3PKH6_9BACT|nr:phospholipase D-like domain-containing protein [Fodinibius salsisoli]MCW9706444.1 cardiolipin synthase B [Fodinibius salsisoli]
MAYQEILESTVGIPFTSGNTVEVLKNGVEIFPAMLQAIQEAQHRVDFLTFVYWKGDIAQRMAHSLSKKAEEGVEVRVILDSYGAAFMTDGLTEMMEESGVEISWFRPFKQWKIWKTDNRTHRKVLICDGKVAFTGGVGIAEEWEGDARDPSEYRETHFRIEGPAVRGLQSAFLENWIEAGHQLDSRLPRHQYNGERFSDREQAIRDVALQVVRTSASVRWSDIVILYQTLIVQAQDNIKITTAYFNPNQPMVELLCKAAERGVEIDIMIPGKHTDQRVANIAGSDRFNELLQCGINIWFYQKTMLHAKVMIVDDVISCIGSANFNHRSMLKDDEINLIANNEALASVLLRHFEDDLTSCEQVTKGQWERRSMWQRALETISKPFKQEI